MAVKSNLKNLQSRIAILNVPTKYLLAGAVKARELILTQWDQATGADEKVLKKLSPAYAEKKMLSGRLPEPNMQWTGAMRRGFIVKKKNDLDALLTFQGAEMGKARGNYAKRPGLFKISKRIKGLVRDFVFDRILADAKKISK